MDFEQIYQERVEKCSHETAFNKEEARVLHDLLWEIPAGSAVLEIGVEYGRSTAIIGSVAELRSHRFTAVDPVLTDHVKRYHLGEWKLPINFLQMTSHEAACALQTSYFSLIHIDGDHSYEAVSFDIHAWAPRILKGGFMCFDDYDHPGLEGVKRAVDEYFMEPIAQLRPTKWDCRGLWGNKLMVFQKLA